MHTIRLQGPWEYEVLARTTHLADGTRVVDETDLPPPGTVQMPCCWSESLGADFRGLVRYRRRFGRPSNLDADERVELVVGAIDAMGEVHLNNELIAVMSDGCIAARVDVTSRLNFRNELLVDVELPALSDGAPPIQRPTTSDRGGGLVGIVRLEILKASETP